MFYSVQIAAEKLVRIFFELFLKLYENCMTSIFTYIWRMELYDKHFRCMELKDKHFRFMKVNPGSF